MPAVLRFNTLTQILLYEKILNQINLTQDEFYSLNFTGNHPNLFSLAIFRNISNKKKQPENTKNKTLNLKTGNRLIACIIT